MLNRKGLFNFSTLFLSAVLACFFASGVFAGPAQIVIVNINAAGVGFNDPTPAEPVGGNPGTTLGEQRRIAFEYAASLWSARLNSDVPIRIRAQFTPLGTNVLGSAGAVTFVRNFPGAPMPDTWYHVALANSLAGFDLTPTGDDINANFSTNFNFYLGLDNNHGSQNDLVAVLLHEFAHGLGFSQTASLTSGQFLGAGNPVVRSPDPYNRRLLDTTLGLYWPEMTPAQRVTSATNSGKVVFDGSFVNEQVPNVLSFGIPILRINSPASIAGAYPAGTASFGQPLSGSGLTGNIVQGLDAANTEGPTTTDGCSPLTNPEQIVGNIAIIDRGTCTFVIKAINAQNAGAVAMIIADNAAGSPPAGLGGTDPSITIPSIRVTQTDGNTIKAQLGAGVNGTLALDLSVLAGADPLGRMRVNAPFPVASGSSISHYDPIAFRNLLMEPAINPDLTHKLKAPDDLTFELLRQIGWTFPDADGDGVVDDEDCNPNSNLAATIVIGGFDSGVSNKLFANGCTMSDVIANIAAGAGNHGQFESSIAALTNGWVSEGLITGKEKGAIQSSAARARIP